MSDELMEIANQLLATPFFVKVTKNLNKKAKKFLNEVNCLLDVNAFSDPLTLFLAIRDIKDEYLELLEVSEYIRGILFHELDKKEGKIDI